VRDEYLQEAQTIVEDPNALINLVSRRSKQLKHGSKPLIESLEKLEPEDVALREIIEGKITYQPWDQSLEDWSFELASGLHFLLLRIFSYGR